MGQGVSLYRLEQKSSGRVPWKFSLARVKPANSVPRVSPRHATRSRYLSAGFERRSISCDSKFRLSSLHEFPSYRIYKCPEQRFFSLPFSLSLSLSLSLIFRIFF